MSGRASAGQVKSLALQVGDGVPSDISEMDARRNLADMSQIQAWLRLGLIVDLSQVDMAAVEAMVHPKILEQIAENTISVLPAFDVATRFHEMTEKERKTAEVPIGWMNDNAKRLAKGLVEPETPEATLTLYRLRKASVDGPIISQLRGDRDVEAILTTWGQMYEMMKAQAHGEQGILLTNGYANIFYIPMSDGQIWAVRCGWGSDGRDWRVDAWPVTHPDAWNAGHQVVSR